MRPYDSATCACHCGSDLSTWLSVGKALLDADQHIERESEREAERAFQKHPVHIAIQS